MLEDMILRLLSVLLLKFYFYLCVHLHASVHMWVPVEARRGPAALELELQVLVSCLMRVLRTVLGPLQEQPTRLLLSHVSIPS